MLALPARMRKNSSKSGSVVPVLEDAPQLLFDSAFCHDTNPFGLPRNRQRSEGIADEVSLFLFVAFRCSGGRACTLRAASVMQRSLAGVQQRLQVLVNKAPWAHVARLFLDPVDLNVGSRLVQDRLHLALRERIHQLHS